MHFKEGEADRSGSGKQRRGCQILKRKLRLELTDSVGKLLTTRGVQTGPGAMTLHLIFLAASSVAIPFVIVVMAPCRTRCTVNDCGKLPCFSITKVESK